MNKSLKCVFFGDRNVIGFNNYLYGVDRLIGFLLERNIRPVILSNDRTDERLFLEKNLKNKYRELIWYIADRDNTPKKPKSESVSSVLQALELEANEAIYVGNSDPDMKTAVNSNLLFLNASWCGKNIDYGFEFQTPYEIARFIDVFCQRDNLWSYAINDRNLEYYALGIYGTWEEKYKIYSDDAREAVKYGRGHPDFWIKYLLSTVYFSGLHERIDYIAPYPSHKQGSTPTVMEEAVITFAKCFRKKYLKDLITRHTNAVKSSYARTQGKQLDHLNQLNTINLNSSPIKDSSGKRYKNCPLQEGKTVLVIDDFCTQGYSLEAARVYIEQTGAKVILLSLLKTINKNYSKADIVKQFSPFQANRFTPIEKTLEYPFYKHIIEKSADREIRHKLETYDEWKW